MHLATRLERRLLNTHGNRAIRMQIYSDAQDSRSPLAIRSNAHKELLSIPDFPFRIREDIVAKKMPFEKGTITTDARAAQLFFELYNISLFRLLANGIQRDQQGCRHGQSLQ
jgi:hypothetical protein